MLLSACIIPYVSRGPVGGMNCPKLVPPAVPIVAICDLVTVLFCSSTITIHLSPNRIHKCSSFESDARQTPEGLGPLVVTWIHVDVSVPNTFCAVNQFTALWLPAKRQRIGDGVKILLDIAKESSDWFPPLKSALGGVSALIKHYEVFIY